MNIIQAAHVFYDYVRRDENDRVEEVSPALQDLSLSIEKGSFVCVLGHNGSGKSTFAKLINALQLPREGTVLVADMDTRDESKLLKIREAAGMVFQNPDNQIIANVVEEDVAFGPENIGVPTPEIWKRVDASLKAVGMQVYRLKSPNRLSGGQKQRVAIAGVMAMMPQCIILDEPTAMLDPSGRREVLKTVHELNRKEGITILHITHYMEEAVDADRIVVMDGGKVVMDGKPREIFSRVEELKALSLCVPQVTELAYELKQAGLNLPDGILTREELVQYLAPMLRARRQAAHRTDSGLSAAEKDGGNGVKMQNGQSEGSSAGAAAAEQGEAGGGAAQVRQDRGDSAGVSEKKGTDQC